MHTCSLKSIQIFSLTLTHNHIIFSLLKATRPALCLYISDRKTHAQTSSLLLFESLNASCVDTEVERWWVRGRPHVPSGRRLTISGLTTLTAWRFPLHSTSSSTQPVALLLVLNKVKSLNVWYPQATRGSHLVRDLLQGCCTGRHHIIWTLVLLCLLPV